MTKQRINPQKGANANAVAPFYYISKFFTTFLISSRFCSLNFLIGVSAINLSKDLSASTPILVRAYNADTLLFTALKFGNKSGLNEEGGEMEINLG